MFKKLLTSGLLIFLSLHFAQAQSFNAGGLAGINASQVGGDGYSGFNKAGLLVGLYSNIDISQKVNLQFEINYSQKGSRKNRDIENNDTEEFLLRLDYIEIPIMAKFRNNKFTFEGGVYYGQLVNQYLRDENGPFDIPEPLNKFKNYDIGGLAGVNFNFTKNIIMNWRFSHSILPVRKYDSGANWRFESGMTNMYLSFTMRYKFLGDDGA